MPMTATVRNTSASSGRFAAVAVMIAAAVLATPTTSAQSPAARPPAIGERAPDFTLNAIEGASLSLARELARGPVVLIVGRGWVGYQCPFCNRQFGDFLRHAANIEAAGAQVIWVYPGPTDQVNERAKEFVDNRPFPPNFRFVLDPNYTFTERYGLRWDAPKETAYPATFVIDRGGVVRYALVSRTHGDRAPATDVLAALSTLKK
jgi:peroxiredoxin